MELIASLPWPIGIVFGILAFVAIRYGLGWHFAASGSPITQEMGRQLLSSDMFAPLAWMALAICWLCALLSYFASRKRKQLLATQIGLDSLRAMSWREFEMLVGEAFRRQGYSIEETGLGGADGGVDLILRKAGRTELVQCKQWRRERISVSVVREMWGLLHHHRADAVKIVCIGDFTRDAMAFAQDKAIELIGGERLLEIVRHVQSTANNPAPARIEPPFEVAQTLTALTCPSCGGHMVHRSNRRTGESFWGCGAYPRCKGTRAIQAQ
ncbi:restriction endonuclease [Lysobacter tyrosinilyticus]